MSFSFPERHELDDPLNTPFLSYFKHHIAHFHSRFQDERNIIFAFACFEGYLFCFIAMNYPSYITEHKTLWLSIHVELPDLYSALSKYFLTRKIFRAPRKVATNACVFLGQMHVDDQKIIRHTTIMLIANSSEDDEQGWRSFTLKCKCELIVKIECCHAFSASLDEACQKFGIDSQ